MFLVSEYLLYFPPIQQYYEDLQKAVEVKEALAAEEEAENETKQSYYLNMAGNLNYANIQRSETENNALQSTGNTDEDNDDDDDAYVQITQSSSISESNNTANQGYVTLSSIESLTLSSGREGREAGRGTRSGRGSVRSRASSPLLTPVESVEEETESLL